MTDPIAKLSFLTFGLALLGALGLVIDLVIGPQVAAGVVGGVAVLILGLWVVMPKILLARQDGEDPPAY